MAHWVVITLIRFFKSSVEPEEEDPVQKLREEMEEIKKENHALKAEIAKVKEILMKKEHQAPQEKPSKAMVVDEIK